MKSLILPPLSSLYGAITRARSSLYQRGTFKTEKLARPVISVGNITTGGTGKSPLVEFVARTLAADGQKVCILTRGYGRKNANDRVLVSDGSKVFSNPANAGDEPYLLACNLVGIAAVISDANRFAAGEGAIKHLATNCFVLDDGFQHLQLARELDIVTVDATNPFGGGQLLPYGRLREDVSGLKRADCFVLTRCDQVNTVNAIQQELAKLSGDRPAFLSRMATSRIARLNEDDPQTPTDPVAAFCAIGNPESFFKHLALNGCDPVLRKAFPDHHVYSQPDIDGVVAAAKHSGAKSLITTAKDAVKLPALQFSLPCYSLDVEIKIDNEEEFKRLVLSSLTG
jgi:tetraacyldisaccharide 4'-kinase